MWCPCGLFVQLRFYLINLNPHLVHPNFLHYESGDISYVPFHGCPAKFSAAVQRLRESISVTYITPVKPVIFVSVKDNASFRHHRPPNICLASPCRLEKILLPRPRCVWWWFCFFGMDTEGVGNSFQNSPTAPGRVQLKLLTKQAICIIV